MEDRSANKMWLVRHLEVTRQIMLEDLKVVKVVFFTLADLYHQKTNVLESACLSVCPSVCLSVYKMLAILSHEFLLQFCCYCFETLYKHRSCNEVV